MSKHLFKATKVLFDAHTCQYEVYYRKWLFWHFDSVYKYDAEPKRPIHYRTKEKAKEKAIERASAMLETIEVWRKSNGIW